MSAGEALPPLSPGAIPPAIRSAGPDAVEGFRAGLGFERLFLAELLSAALPEAEEGEDPRLAMLPETLADAVVGQGGIGVAAELAATLERGG